MAKKDKFSNLTRNTLLFTIGSFGSKFVSLLLVPVYTAVLSTSDYGDVDIVTSTVLLLVPLLTLNVQDAVLRFSLNKEYDIGQVLGLGLKIVHIGTAGLAIVLGALFYFGFLGLTLPYLLFVLTMFYTGAMSNCVVMYLKAKDMARVIAVGGILCTLATCVLNIYLLVVVGAGVNGYLLANALGSVVGLTYYCAAGKVLTDVKLRVVPGLISAMVRYSAPLIVNSVAWWINSASNRYIIVFLCGAAANGVFSIAYKIPSILASLQSVFYNAWSVSAITEYDERDADGFIGNIYTVYSCVTYISCSILLILNIPLAALLYSNDFFDAWQYVPMLLVGTAFNGLALFEGCLFAAANRTKDVATTTLAGSALCLISNFCFVILFGPAGASLATLFGYLFVWICRTIKMRSFIKIKVSWTRQVLGAIALLAQCVIASFGSYYLVQFGLLSAILLVEAPFFRSALRMVKKRFAKGQRA